MSNDSLVDNTQTLELGKSSDVLADQGNTLTFVTCYLHDKAHSPQNDEWNVGRLNELVSIGIPLYIFVSNENADEIAFLQSATNIHIEVIDKYELWVFKQLKNRQYNLPAHRNLEKDTEDHLAISHSKVEMVNRAIEHNPWKTGHFAYIDFNITYLFWDKLKTYEYIRQLSKRTFFDKILMFPGCSSPISIENIGSLTDVIYWRFCGGFFVGDAKTLQEWWNKYQEYFVEYLETYNKLTWDVNFWAWVETAKRWDQRWYSANHNDSIITAISADFITKNMISVSRRVKHNYPVIPHFRPTSASYLKTDDGRRWLNTRYVNYWLYNNGCYGYPSNLHVIENKNMLCELDEGLAPIADTFIVVDEEIDIPKYSGDVFSKGLEDVRLFVSASEDEYSVSLSSDDISLPTKVPRSNNVLKFIATNVDYSPNGKNNMVIGDYAVDEHRISNVKMILPPSESWCEKNWIPISARTHHLVPSSGVLPNNEDLFIYKWSPLEIGRINHSTGTLEIIMTYSITAPYFEKVRGSTTFVDTPDGLLGVVHFSEDHNPRHYYHMLVLLDRDSLKPLKYSNCFCFKSLGVEFCIGFTNEMPDEYVFWISQMDRDPMTVFIQKSEIRLCFEF